MALPRDFERLTDREVRSVLRDLRRSLRRLKRQVQTGRGTDFDLFRARARQVAIEQELAALEDALAERLGTVTQRAARLADELSDAPTPTLVGIDAGAVADARSSSAQMVKAVTEVQRRQLRDAVTRGLTGELTTAEVEVQMADALDVDAMANRVERIIRTETGRTWNAQDYQAGQELNALGVVTVSIWAHKGGGRMVPGARHDHVAIDGQERLPGELFNVGQGATDKTPPDGVGYRARFPLDPNLPADQAINCGCTLERRPIEKASEATKRRARELGVDV